MSLPSGALLLRLALFLLLSWGASLGVLQLLLGQRLDRAQMEQMGRDLASGIRLSEVALERFPPRRWPSSVAYGSAPTNPRQAPVKTFPRNGPRNCA